MAKKKEIINIEGLSALYDGVTQNLSRVHSADDAIETKVAAFLAAGLVIITLVFSTLELWDIFAVLGVSIIFITIIISLYVLWSRGYSNTAVSVRKNSDYLDKPSRELLLQLISDCENSLEESGGILNKKVKVYPWILVLFVIGSTLSVFSIYSYSTERRLCQVQNYQHHARLDQSKKVSERCR